MSLGYVSVTEVCQCHWGMSVSLGYVSVTEVCQCVTEVCHCHWSVRVSLEYVRVSLGVSECVRFLQGYVCHTSICHNVSVVKKKKCQFIDVSSSLRKH